MPRTGTKSTLKYTFGSHTCTHGRLESGNP
jgi:hypothetical protein